MIRKQFTRTIIFSKRLAFNRASHDSKSPKKMSSQFDADEKLWKGASVAYPYPGDVYLGEKIIEALKATPDRILQISHEENSELIADDFRLLVIRVAQNLQRRGIGDDDVVGVTCRNSNAVTVLINACVLIGAPLSPLDVAFTKDDIRHMFGQTKPKLVVCDYDAYLKVKKALRELNSDAEVFTTGGRVAGVPEFRDLLSPTGTEDDFVPPKFAVAAWKKILVIICSSGTTGLPKGICATHGQILMWFGFYQNRPMSRSLAFSSTYWASGFYPTVMLASSVNDIRILTNQRFSVEALIELVETRKVTTMIMQPSQLALMVQSKEFKRSDYSSLESIIAGGSMVSHALRKKFTETFPGIRLSVSYGMSEASTTIPMECSEGLAVGKIILPNNIIKIVDESGSRLGVGERGELCVKSLFDFIVSFIIQTSRFRTRCIVAIAGLLQQPRGDRKCR